MAEGAVFLSRDHRIAPLQRHCIKILKLKPITKKKEKGRKKTKMRENIEPCMFVCACACACTLMRECACEWVACACFYDSVTVYVCVPVLVHA